MLRRWHVATSRYKIKCAYKVRLMSVQVSLPESSKLRETPS